jgi:hypothetical protein
MLIGQVANDVARERSGGTITKARNHMKFMLLICPDPTIELSDEDERTISPEAQAWVAEMEGRGVRLRGQELAPVDDATTIRLRKGEMVIADGPFAETKEYIAGFDILECADIDEAVEVASKHPVARFGAVEVRPFHDEPA